MILKAYILRSPVSLPKLPQTCALLGEFFYFSFFLGGGVAVETWRRRRGGSDAGNTIKLWKASSEGFVDDVTNQMFWASSLTSLHLLIDPKQNYEILPLLLCNSFVFLMQFLSSSRFLPFFSFLFLSLLLLSLDYWGSIRLECHCSTPTKQKRELPQL